MGSSRTPTGRSSGLVVARTFRRDHFLLRVRLDGSLDAPQDAPLDRQTLEVAVRGDAVPAVGDPVRLAVDPAAVIVLGTQQGK